MKKTILYIGMIACLLFLNSPPALTQGVTQMELWASSLIVSGVDMGSAMCTYDEDQRMSCGSDDLNPSEAGELTSVEGTSTLMSADNILGIEIKDERNEPDPENPGCMIQFEKKGTNRHYCTQDNLLGLSNERCLTKKILLESYEKKREGGMSCSKEIVEQIDCEKFCMDKYEIEKGECMVLPKACPIGSSAVCVCPKIGEVWIK